MRTKSTGWWLFLGGIGVGLVFRALVELGTEVKEASALIIELDKERAEYIKHMTKPVQVSDDA